MPDTIVCFSHLRWDFVYQRPQHLMSRAAEQFQVLFVEEPVIEPNGQPHLALQKKNEAHTIVVPTLSSDNEKAVVQRDLLECYLASHVSGQTLLWYYSPMALAISDKLKHDLCVYDCMDELSAFRGAPPEMLNEETRLLERTDLVFTGGASLYQAKRSRHPHVYEFPSSVDRKHFSAARHGQREPADQEPLPRPRFGFFGVIDERMDLGLLKSIAERRPDWQFIMIGPVVKIHPESLPRLPNIAWLGPKNYSELPSYLAGWNAAFMPFAINEATRFISPTKTPEFLAAGLPVVSTPIADVVRPYGAAGLVKIAPDPRTFVSACEEALQPATAAWCRAVGEHLSRMSWDQTWSDMYCLIQNALGRPETGAARIEEPAHV